MKNPFYDWMETVFVLLIFVVVVMGTFVYLQQLKRRKAVVEKVSLPENVKHVYITKKKPLLLNADIIGLPNNFENIKFVKYTLELYTDKELTKKYVRGMELPRDFEIYTNPISLPTSVTYRIKINGEWY